MTLNMSPDLDLKSMPVEADDAEWAIRRELAAAFRIGHRMGWNASSLNHISARIPGRDEVLINPAVGWDEVTASSLVKLNYQGEQLTHADLAVGRAGANFHSAILGARPDIGCVLHVHPTAGIALSTLVQGLVIYDQNTCRLYNEIAYHDFQGLVDAKDEATEIIELLDHNHVIIMRNHGLLTVGQNIGEAFAYMSTLIDACRLQMQILASGAEAVPVPDEVAEATYRHMQRVRRNGPLGMQDWAMFQRQARRDFPDHVL